MENNSVGLQRQWPGSLGKVDNGQVGVYMGYASRKEYALANERLYLPGKWANNKTLKKKCCVPKNIRYKTRQELAFEMLENNGEYLPHRWIKDCLRRAKSEAGLSDYEVRTRSG